MKGNILSIDLGYGSIKYCIMDPNSGKIIKIDKEVSGVLEVPEGDSSMISSVDTYHEFKGKRYLIGELSTKLDLEPIDIMDYEGFKKVGPILMSYLLNKFSTSNIHKISIGITPVIWDKRDDYLEYVTTELDLTEGKLELHTQGVSGHYTYLRYGLDINPDDTKINIDSKSLNYIGADLGFNTMDIYLCVNGSILDYGIRGYAKKGITIVAEKVKEYVFTHLGLKLNDVESKEVIELGGVKKRGKLMDMSEKIAEFIVEYLLDTMKLIESEYGNQLNKMDNILISGGGAEVIKIYMERSPIINNKIEELYGDEFLMLPKSYGEYYNCIGYAILSTELNNSNDKFK